MAKRNTKRAASSKPHVEKQPDTTPNGKQLGGVTGKGFMPGKSGNPNGRRPLAVTLAQHFRDIGSEIVDKATGWTRIDLAIRRLFMDAAGGKSQATELILDRGWGKVMQPVELTWLDKARSAGMNIEEAQALYADLVIAARERLARIHADGSLGTGAIGEDSE